MTLVHRIARHAKQPVVHLTVLATAVVVAYAPTLDRYFVSEDFPILRRIAATGLAETVRAEFTGPMLGVTLVALYRPVAVILLRLEYLAWGVDPAPYLVTHLAVHLVNAWLVWQLGLEWSGRRTVALGAAAVFALYPLQHNTVVWIGAYATLASTTFALLALVLYERWRRTRRRLHLGASLGSFTLALLSYEQAVVVPAIILIREAVATIGAGERDVGTEPRSYRALVPVSRTARLAVMSTFLIVLAGYLAARWVSIGQVIGGYAEQRNLLLLENVSRLTSSLAATLGRLAWPGQARPLGVSDLLMTAALLLVGWALLAREETSLRRTGLLAAAWIAVGSAPFAFLVPPPAAARYWYFSSVGLGLGLASMAHAGFRMSRAISTRDGVRRAARLGLIAAVFFVAVSYLRVHADNTAAYAEAGARTRLIQQRTLRLARGGERIFVVGHPTFVTGSRGRNLAQVYHWGLHDALRPPFVASGPDVHPLPPLPDDELHPVLERGDLGATWRWQESVSRYRRVGSPALRRVAPIVLRVDPAGRLWFRGTGGHRLVLLTRMGAVVEAIAPAPDGQGWAEATLPEAVVTTVRRLYGGRMFAWIDSRDGAGELAASRLVTIDAFE